MSAVVISDAAELPLPREDAFRKARRHSRRVRMLKLVLPLAAVTMAGTFAWSAYRASTPAVVMSTASSTVEQNQLVMADPRLEGFARDGRPFAVDALRAIQTIGNDSIIHLDAINARLPMEGSWITVTAPGGIYDRVKNVLDVSGETSDAIKVVSTDGATVFMRTAQIDMKTGTLRATDSVDLKRQDGAITAEQLDVSKGGKVLVFEKNVRMTLSPKDQASGEGNANP